MEGEKADDWYAYRFASPSIGDIHGAATAGVCCNNEYGRSAAIAN